MRAIGIARPSAAMGSPLRFRFSATPGLYLAVSLHGSAQYT